jgi:diaminohydroxyphosphoribosylaminopyrimidine deaminase / 5-amino-6-(5-phosphoribosylamino)uracil reductase
VKNDLKFVRLALRLARRGYGTTSPNPMVGAVLVKTGKIIGRGWHRRAGLPHAEIEALRDAQKRGHNPRGATLYVTLEPCCTHGRTPPCTDAIIAAGIKRVVVGATDPNPRHAGKGFKILKRAGIQVISGILSAECERLNEAFNHWIVHRTPFVTVKAAMTLDGKIATASGESKWITGEAARAEGMRLRQGHDAILVGVNTILADNPRLTIRTKKSTAASPDKNARLRRIVLDSRARTPLTAKILNDEFAALTTIVVTKNAPANRVAALSKKARVLVAPTQKSALNPTSSLKLPESDITPPRSISLTKSGNPGSAINLPWLLGKLGIDNVNSLLVEGGGEVNASFLLGRIAHRIAFFYAPKILGGRDSRKAVAGEGAKKLNETVSFYSQHWRKLGPDLFLTARLTQTPLDGTRPRQ